MDSKEISGPWISLRLQCFLAKVLGISLKLLEGVGLHQGCHDAGALRREASHIIGRWTMIRKMQSKATGSLSALDLLYCDVSNRSEG